MTEAVLDASALLALLRAEPGREVVQKVLAASAIASVNLAEVISHFARHGSAERDIRAVLDPLPISRVPFDDALAYAAGMLIPMTRPAGLSLGDRACLALAQHLGVKALTADRAWQSIANTVGISIEIIR
ncbi:MAG TPA: type II toxin-antitoxin system VapC family toxin [Acetobacteraceae bacterium]|nr:type II toxin-antitoxin system VapC family toxin [Acetobacteraceae bacterium]